VLILLTYELKSNADKEEEVKKYNCRKGAAKADD